MSCYWTEAGLLPPGMETMRLISSGADRFRAEQPRTDRLRMFGGQLLAQAVLGASHTVPEGRIVHSFHATFLRAGENNVPAEIVVSRLRDGRSFSARHFEVLQSGRAILHGFASFHDQARGPVHQSVVAPDVPGPEDLPEFRETLASVGYLEGHIWDEVPHIETRVVHVGEDGGPGHEPGRTSRAAVWVRARGRIPAAPALHAALAAYMSDLTALSPAFPPHGERFYNEHVQTASLDHAMWFHSPIRADQWLLYVMDSPVARHERALATGRMFTPSGQLVASTAQEGLFRVPQEGAAARPVEEHLTSWHTQPAFRTSRTGFGSI